MRAVLWKTVSVANVTWIERGGAAAMQQQQLVQLHDLIELDPHGIDRGSHPLLRVRIPSSAGISKNLLAQCGAAIAPPLLVEPQPLQATTYTTAA
jgi:hypothetical protein